MNNKSVKIWRLQQPTENKKKERKKWNEEEYLTETVN